MAKLLYQGHSSFRVITNDGIVMFIDPYTGLGYDVAADIILVTHQHGDHNQIEQITQKQGCVVITEAEALAGKKHNSFSIKGIDIMAVSASNSNHSPDECVGYIVTVDGLKLYFSGDTSKTEQMASFVDMNLDYAFLCCDGFYNMGLEEASECASLINAKQNVPVHVKPGELFDMELAMQFSGPNRLIIDAGEEIEL